MKTVFLQGVRIYQKVFSLDTGWLGRFYPSRVCRFTPTCSQYTYEAVEKYGLLKGLLLGLKRILRCHPGAAGGDDPLK